MESKVVVGLLLLAVSSVSGTQCPANTFPCDDRCLRLEHVCDGKRDCMFSMDEIVSETCKNYGGCKPGTFQCNDKCVPNHRWCDRERNCRNVDDEGNCTEPYQPLKLCSKHSSGPGWRAVLISTTQVCDGRADCVNYDDESNCNSPEKCTKDAFFCDRGCMPKSRWCDRVTDCKDGSDEANCTAPAALSNSTTAAAPTSTGTMGSTVGSAGHIVTSDGHEANQGHGGAAASTHEPALVPGGRVGGGGAGGRTSTGSTAE